MAGWGRAGLLVILWAGTASGDGLPDLREFTQCLPGTSWTRDPPRVELGYVRPYDLPGLHGTHVGLAQPLGAGLLLETGLEWMRAGAVEYRRPRLGVRWRGGAVSVGTLGSLEEVSVEGFTPRRRPRARVHLSWRWGTFRLGGSWVVHAPRARSTPSPAELVLGIAVRPWELGLRRRPSPWRDTSVWEGGFQIAAGSRAHLGMRLTAEDVTVHLGWIRSKHRLGLALTLDGPRARGLALSAEWGR